MTRPKLKICGITTLEDARFCAAGGADYLGFIQHPTSPRYIAPRDARAVIEWLHGCEPVGVFVDRTPDDVNRIVAEAGFTHAQLHGAEPPAWCRAVDVPVIKAFRVRPDTDPDRLAERMEPYRNAVAYFLLDTYDPGRHGGTGAAFDWRVARALAPRFPLFLAGGIGPENVEEAVRTVQPAGIDASSRLEETPGRKDFALLHTFFDRFFDTVPD